MAEPLPATSRDLVRVSTALRAFVAAVLAIVVTFSADHSALFGLLVFGAFEVAQGLVVIVCAAGPWTTSGRVLVLLRAAIGVLFGVLALALLHGGLGTLLLLATVTFLITGALEVLLGIRRADQGPTSRDSIAVGGLSVLVGALLSLVQPDVVFDVGVIGAWAAVVAVYLGIAAASVHPAAVRSEAT